MKQEQIHWNGLKIGELEVGELIGRGAFSSIYKATDKNGSFALKVAGVGFGGGEVDTGCFSSHALEHISSGVLEFVPNSQDLLREQARYLEAIAGIPGVVNCLEFVDDSAFSFARLELIQGPSLRKLMQANSASLSLFHKLLGVLESLDHNVRYRGHGDLKPENIMVSAEDQITLIDPGYYGRIRAENGRDLSAVITTPSYYPELKANDIWAAGFILWEIACGEHVLKTNNSMEAKLSEKFAALIHRYETTANHNFTALRYVRAPHEMRTMSQELSRVVAKSVGLEFGSDGVDFCGPYKSFTEFRNAIEGVI